MNHNDNLISELQQARHAWRQRHLAMEEAREIYIESRTSATKAKGVVEEILMEIETGRTGRPILDAVNGTGDTEPESAELGLALARSGFDLVTSRPESTPETNGAEAPPTKRPRKKAAVKGGGE